MTKILISPGYGAGWSTWNSEHKWFLLKDPTLIEMAGRKAPVEEVDAYIKSTLGENAYVHTGGWRNIKVVELPAGTLFQVTEHEGYEGIKTLDGDIWSIA